MGECVAIKPYNKWQLTRKNGRSTVDYSLWHENQPLLTVYLDAVFLTKSGS